VKTSHDLLELARVAARTKRCHTKSVIHQQGVGEHTFNALVILDAVYPDADKNVWRAMLYHDLPEAVTGDVPAPAKWDNPKLEEALREVEEDIHLDYQTKTFLSEEEHRYVKFADIMELVFYGIEEYMMGNRGVEDMVRRAIGAVRNRELISLNERTQELTEYAMALFESAGGNTHGTL